MNNPLENHCQMGVLSVNTIKNRMILFILIQTPTLLGQQIAAFNQVSTCIDQNIPLLILLLLHLLLSTKNQIISLKKVANHQSFINNVYFRNLDFNISFSKQSKPKLVFMFWDDRISLFHFLRYGVNIFRIFVQGVDDNIYHWKVLNLSRAKLKALRPLGPAARGVLALYGEHPRALELLERAGETEKARRLRDHLKNPKIIPTYGVRTAEFGDRASIAVAVSHLRLNDFRKILVLNAERDEPNKPLPGDPPPPGGPPPPAGAAVTPPPRYTPSRGSGSGSPQENALRAESAHWRQPGKALWAITLQCQRWPQQVQ